jgi:hypothetical protein
MRHLRWVPFTFIAGLHGFALFAPYAALVMIISITARYYRQSAIEARVR